MQVQHVDEKKITWRKLKNNFQNKYLIKCYYDRKTKELFELKLGTMTMDEYERIVLELLKYIDLIKNEQFKIQRFLLGIPSIFNGMIQYDDLGTLGEVIRRDKSLYDQHRGIPTLQNDHEYKKKGKME